MSSVDSKPPAAGPGDAQSAAPPDSKLVVVMFPDQTKVDQAICAIQKLAMAGGITLYRSAIVARGSDGKVLVQDITEEGHGGVATGALIGGLSGLTGGPLAAAIGAGAGALIAWSAELVNKQAVTELANKDANELAPGRRAIVAEVAEDAEPSFEALMEANGGTVLK